MAKPTPVYLEVGAKRVFACAVDWPGWARSGRTEELALAALADYHERYTPVAQRAVLPFPARLAADFTVVERVRGNASTDFGAPDIVPELDRSPLTAAERRRVTALLRAAWEEFDATVAETEPELRKGPRGGGRDRDKMVDHVNGADAMGARQLGLRPAVPALGDDVAIGALRDAIVGVLSAPPSADPRVKWPQRYAVRRIAWHVLDHTWEMADRRLSAR